MSYNFSKFKRRTESEIVDLMFAGEIKKFKNYKKLLSEEEITEEYNKMTDKFMFDSEEQFEKVVRDCYPYDLMESNFIDRYKQKAKQLGYIRKSKIQTLVEEAEEMYRIYMDSTDNERAGQTIDDLYAVIQALKKDHPEFKK